MTKPTEPASPIDFTAPPKNETPWEVHYQTHYVPADTTTPVVHDGPRGILWGAPAVHEANPIDLCIRYAGQTLGRVLKAVVEYTAEGLPVLKLEIVNPRITFSAVQTAETVCVHGCTGCCWDKP